MDYLLEKTKQANEWFIAERLKKRMDYRPLKLKLLQEIGICFWCGVELIDFIAPPFKKSPNNTATIDHIKSRYHRKQNEIVLKVLACLRCNMKRSTVEHKKYGPLPVKPKRPPNDY